jgi:hypothetical protein
MMGLATTKTAVESELNMSATSVHTTEPSRLDEQMPGTQYDEQSLPEDDWH